MYIHVCVHVLHACIRECGWAGVCVCVSECIYGRVHTLAWLGRHVARVIHAPVRGRVVWVRSAAPRVGSVCRSHKGAAEVKLTSLSDEGIRTQSFN